MGLAQSKRSVNITTDPAKDGVVTEGAGKLEKIGEIDQLKSQANGNAQHSDGDNEKKVETDAAENEKDSATEKTNKEGGDAGGGVSDTSAVAVSPTSEKEEDSDANNKTLENGSNDESLNDSKAATADEATKKAKKPKKKWSFRSLSFSKKDKQKPVKKEKDEERVSGDCEKVPEEPTEDAAAATAVAQEAASTTGEAGTSDTKTESIPAAVEVTTTTATAAAEVTTTSAAVDTTKVEEPAIEAVTVATQESSATTAVAPLAAAEKEPEVTKEIVENGQREEAKKAPEVEEHAPVAPKAQEEQESEATSAVVAPAEEKVVEQAAVEVNTPTPSTTTTTTSAAVEVENKPEAPVESVSAATTSTTPPPSETITNVGNNTTNVVSVSESAKVVESATVADGGESTPPPPLPSIPPPSQVMVFVEASMSQVASEDPLVSVSVNPSDGQSDMVEKKNDEVQERKAHVEATVVEGTPVATRCGEIVGVVEQVHSQETIGEVGPLNSVAPVSTVVPATVAELTAETVAVPIVAEEQKSEPVTEEPGASTETVAQVQTAPAALAPPMDEEIKETATKAVGEILEAAVDKIESGKVQLPVVDAAPEVESIQKVDEKLSSEVTEIGAADEISNNIDDLPPPPPPPAVDDEETVPDSLPSPLPTIAAAVPAELESALGADDAKQDHSVLSVDISSPLPQNSLESLPSPPTLSQSDVSLPPPPESPAEAATEKQTLLTLETESVTALPPPPAPSSTNTTTITSSSIPSSLPEAGVEVEKHGEVDTQQQVHLHQHETVGTHDPVTVAALPAEEVAAVMMVELEGGHNISESSSSSQQQAETSSESDVQQQQQQTPAVPVVPVATPSEVEETVAQKQNGTVENGTSNGTTKNGTTENGTVENAQNGVHETPATESLNGEHKKEDKIPEKAAQLQQQPPAAPVMAE